jgi:hypothetical protein
MLTTTKKDLFYNNIHCVDKKYSIIESIKRNFNDSNKSIIVLNPCNNTNTFGAGFNKTIANEFPSAKENYHLLGSSNLKNKLGYTQFVPVATNNKYKNNIIVANMICQNGIISKSNPRPLNYYYYGMCLSRVQDYIKQYKESNDLDVMVFTKKIDQFVTGANHFFIMDIINDVLRPPTFTTLYE